MDEFKREERYVVLKIKDILKYISEDGQDALMGIGNQIAAGRRGDGKPPFNAVVVEQDWPEFDVVWQMIEDRMLGRSTPVPHCTYVVGAADGYQTTWRTACGHRVVCEVPEEVGICFAPMPDEDGKFCHHCGKLIHIKKA